MKKRKFSDLKLNTKFTLVIILSLMVMISIFSGVLFYTLEQNVVEESSDYMEYTIQRSLDALSNHIDSVNMATQFFLSDEELLDILARSKNNEEISTEEWLEFKNTKIAALERLVNSNPVLHGVRVFATNDEVQEMMPILYRHSRMENQSWSEKENFYGWNYDYSDKLFSSFTMKEDQRIASLVTAIERRGEGEIGIIEAAIRMEELFPSLYEEILQEWGYFVTEEGQILSGNEEESITAIVSREMDTITEEAGNGIGLHYVHENGKYLMIAGSSVKELGGSLFFVKDITENIAYVYRMRTIFIIVMLLFFVLLAFGISGIVRLLLKQFYEILQVIRRVQKGDLEARTKKYSGDEMGELSDQLNTMLDRIQSLMKENLDRELLVKNSEIRALQNQINAHFIYNVLETIKMMAEIDEKYEIADSLTALGKLLRYGMRWVHGNVKISDELEYIRNYVALINLRFDYEILLSLNLPEDIIEQEIPKMSLQPIVENAILHGIEEVAEDTTIYIKGYHEDNVCVIEITDSGKGMSEQQVKKLEERIAGKLDASGGNAKSNGIGLKNVQDRIHIAFGKEYGLSIISREGLFTKVIVRIPYQGKERWEL